jgi:arginase
VSEGLAAIHVLGVPFNSAGTARGVARAPTAFRQAGLIHALEASGRRVIDRGNVLLDPPVSSRDPVSRIIAPDALVEMIRRTRTAVRDVLDDAGFPLVIGGDCPVLIGCLSAAGPSPVPGLLFLDGHEDAWPPAASTTGEAADMELGFLLGRTVDTLPADLIQEIPRLDPDRVVALGPRDASELASANIPSLGDAIRIVRPDAIAEDPRGIGRAAAGQAGAIGSWWLHVDLDILSTDSLDAVDYPLPGGLTWGELTDVTTQAVRVPGLRGMDVTIYNPDLDPAGGGARQIIRYLAEATASMTTSASVREIPES